jgi:hypothetical protein
MPRSVRGRCGLYGLRPASLSKSFATTVIYSMRRLASSNRFGKSLGDPESAKRQALLANRAPPTEGRARAGTPMPNRRPRCLILPGGLDERCESRPGKLRVAGAPVTTHAGATIASPVDRPMAPFAPCVFARDRMGACGTLQGNRFRLRLGGRAGRRPRPGNASRDGAPHWRRFSGSSAWYTNVTVRAMLGSRLETLSTK